MRPIREVYPDCVHGDYFWGTADYGPLLESFGYEILLRVDDHDYQGDSRVIFKDGNDYGLLIFGWGSCSGCDALQACDSYEEIDELRREMHSYIKWYTATALLDHLKTHDWEGDFCWNARETREFVDQAIRLLESVVRG